MKGHCPSSFSTPVGNYYEHNEFKDSQLAPQLQLAIVTFHPMVLFTCLHETIVYVRLKVYRTEYTNALITIGIYVSLHYSAINELHSDFFGDLIMKPENKGKCPRVIKYAIKYRHRLTADFNGMRK